MNTIKLKTNLKTSLKAISFLSTLLLNDTSYAEVDTGTGILVITRADTPISELSKRQIKSVYLGAPTALDLIPVMLESSTTIRQQFNAQVIGLSEARLQSFLAQMRFSGRSIKLVELPDIKQVLNKVTAEPNIIAYVPSDTKLGNDVKILFKRP